MTVPNDDYPESARDVPSPLDYAGRLPVYHRTSRLATACPVVAALSPVLIAGLYVGTLHPYVFFDRYIVSFGEVATAVAVLNVALPVAAVVRIQRSSEELLGVGRAVMAPFIFFGVCFLGELCLFLSFKH